MRLFADREMELEENLKKLTKNWKRRDGRGEATLRRVLAGSGDDD